jgi:hypothetical protein
MAGDIMPFSVDNNSFQVTNYVEKVMIPDYVNALGTTSLAEPYTMFNGNPTLGTSIRQLYPMRLLAFPTITPDLTTQNNNIFMRVGNLNLDIQESVPFEFTTVQMDFFSQTADNAQFDKFYFKSAGVSIGTQLNGQVLALCEKYWSDAVGDPTAPFSGQASLAQVDSQFANMGLRAINGGSNRYIGLHPDSINSMQLAYPNYYNERVNSPIMEYGRAPYLYGMYIYEDVMMILHTNGSFAAPGAVTVTTSVPLTTTINDAFTAVTVGGFTPSTDNVLLQGDLIWFTVGGTPVNSVNPITYQQYANAKKFYVMGMSDGMGGISPFVNSDGAGAATIYVYAPIVANPLDPYRNVSQQVVAGAVVNLLGGANTQYRKNFAFDRSAFLFSNPPLSTYPNPNTPPGSRYSAFPTEILREFEVPETGLKVSLNITAQGDLSAFTNQFVVRTFAGALPFNGYGMTVCAAV